MDLNIIIQPIDGPREEEKISIQKVRMAIKLGFEVVALNVIVDGQQMEGKNLKIPEPPVIKLGDFEMAEVKVAGKTFQVKSRLTCVVSDTNQCHHLTRSPLAKKYDILAVQPMNEKIFQHVCGNMEVDIICLDLASRLPFTLKREQVGQASTRGMFFEIQYAPCLKDRIARRNTISNSRILTQLTNKVNIIISSGSSQVMDLRSCFDAANLGLLFDLPENKCKEAVWSNCKKVLSQAVSRKLPGKGVLFMGGASQLQPSDQWLLKACKMPTTGQEVVSSEKKSTVSITSDCSIVTKQKKKKIRLS
ncbi:ribonuclease P protein subunit p30-like [Limulus polyphemus]|uniref:Ribonuclease P protein subunit p30-like n=1 Tax=Limulus polyphemus TaxID=6850 RepID=A0ABM1BX21_LIMPO|nr:ribonuclease P protein subunit p30-like [Limulus polyphemus]